MGRRYKLVRLETSTVAALGRLRNELCRSSFDELVADMIKIVRKHRAEACEFRSADKLRS